MFERILVPLDGSQLAELALPYGEELGARLGAEVILLHVCAQQHQPYRNMHELYLSNIVKTVEREMERKFPRCEDWVVRTEVLVGEPADVICDYVEKNGVGLVVLATHGASGIKVWTLGSVVDKVVQAVNIPALVVRAKKGQPSRGRKGLISRILLPLDGSETSKVAMPYAVELAKRLKASISLYQMAHAASRHMTPVYIDWDRLDAVMKKQVRAELIKVEKGLRQEGIPVSHAVTLGTDPAAEILEQEAKTKADLVVMATRGGSAVARWVFGSVAEKVLRQGDLPLLLVRKAPA